MEELRFPTFDYYLDESDPNVVFLHRQDGSFVAAFSARGATKEGILEAAKEDRRELHQPCLRVDAPVRARVHAVSEKSGGCRLDEFRPQEGGHTR